MVNEISKSLSINLASIYHHTFQLTKTVNSLYYLFEMAPSFFQDKLSYKSLQTKIIKLQYLMFGDKIF